MGSVIGCHHGPFRDVLAPVHSFYPVLVWIRYRYTTCKAHIVR